MKRPDLRRVMRLTALMASAWLAAAQAATPVPFWLSPQSNLTFDSQVTGQLSAQAGLVVLRSFVESREADYTMAAITARFKQSGSVPVLAYGFANRRSVGGRSESELLSEMDAGQPLAKVEEEGNGDVAFLDVGDAGVRARLVERYVAAQRRLKVDGFAFDLSTRTPSERPAILAKQCKRDASFCPRYAAGMDAVFADLRAALGADSYLVYNGLFNFNPGQIEDQAKLLRHTNAVAVEFFGMDPKEERHSFSRDIRPFIEAIPRLPANKAALVYGRGPWSYTSYLEDYEWQRYLYASFLLAARKNDMFKYHATFQVPTLKGRSGGLDVYADWKVELGDALGAASVRDGLYRREYSNGLVVVAPDDGRGGAVTLPSPMYTPEGEARSGTINLVPGSALILLKRQGQSRPDRRVIDARTMASWQWSQATLGTRGREPVLELRTPEPGRTEEHDLLLDWERSTTPYKRLQIDASLQAGAEILAVAEVDDRQKRSEYAVVVVSSAGGARAAGSGAGVYFKARGPTRNAEPWPRIAVDATAGDKDGIVIDGPKVFEGSGLRFRRWSHLRFQGAMAVAQVSLSRPTLPAELPGER